MFIIDKPKHLALLGLTSVEVPNSPTFTQVRYVLDECMPGLKKKGLVLGAYDGCTPGDYRLSHVGSKVDDETGGKLKDLIKGSGISLGSARLFHNLKNEYFAIAVTGLGLEGLGFNECENINECKENIRVAAAVGVRALQDAGVDDISVEGFTCSEAAAEGAALSVWKYQEMKNKDNQTVIPTLDLYEDPDREGWERGIYKAEAQNLARRLEDTPANLMTPSAFAQQAIEILCPCGVLVEVRDKEWLEAKKMNAFLSMARGSCEPPLFLELSYCGGSQSDKPVVLIGKGVTFDSGGLCLRVCKGMSEYRADMAGAAVIVAVLKALAQLNVPINVNALIPLCENMPGGMAMKPGDVVMGLASKSILVDDTSKEARIILADAISFSGSYKPCLVVTIGTMTNGMRVALAGSSTGVFSTSDVVWRELNRAGAETGDRCWRFPLWKYFSKRLTAQHCCDLNNIGYGRGGEPCSAAAFLFEFSPPVDFTLLDITGTGMLAGEGLPYIRAGTMSGRPTRTLIQFLHQMACPQDKIPEC